MHTLIPGYLTATVILLLVLATKKLRCLMSTAHNEVKNHGWFTNGTCAEAEATADNNKAVEGDTIDGEAISVVAAG